MNAEGVIITSLRVKHKQYALNEAVNRNKPTMLSNLMVLQRSLDRKEMILPNKAMFQDRLSNQVLIFTAKSQYKSELPKWLIFRIQEEITDLEPNFNVTMFFAAMWA